MPPAAVGEIVLAGEVAKGCAVPELRVGEGSFEDCGRGNGWSAWAH